jgi:hypothetical protein
MIETAQPESRFPTELDGIGTDLQAVPDLNQPIQLIWEQSSEDAAVDTVGVYTEFTKIPPRRPRPEPEPNPDVSWSGINRMNRAQETCRRTANFIGGGRIP